MPLSDIEISSLRGELVEYSRQVLDLMKFGITATSALVGFGLSRTDGTAGYIMLVPLLILAPSLSLAMNRRGNIARIAAYLRAFAREGFEYESRLWQLRQRRDLPWANYQIGLLQMFTSTGFFCIALSFLFLFQAGWLLLIPGIAFFVWTGFSLTQWRRSGHLLAGGRLDNILFNAWKQTQNEKD